jgi:AcrR family transcriptional regulator
MTAEAMPDGRNGLAVRPTVLRGVVTRDALLDAAESLVADYGFRAPSHRMIAGLAGVHVALVNYHFSSKELLFEAAVERRAARLAELWCNALNSVRLQPSFTVDAVLSAWWHPFGNFDLEDGGAWRNYLCVVARLASAPDGEDWHARFFGAVDQAFLAALAEAMPAVSAEDRDAGLRYARCLFGEILLLRCGKTGGARRPQGFREDDVPRLIQYLSSGLAGLQQTLPVAAD